MYFYVLYGGQNIKSLNVTNCIYYRIDSGGGNRLDRVGLYKAWTWPTIKSVGSSLAFDR